MPHSQDPSDVHAALARARARTAEILDSIDDCFCALDRDWRFTYLNPRAEQFFGRTRADLLGMVAWEVFPAADDSPLREHARRLAAERAPQHFEMLSPGTGRWIGGVPGG